MALEQDVFPLTLSISGLKFTWCHIYDLCLH
jgi:hypothetical protein